MSAGSLRPFPPGVHGFSCPGRQPIEEPVRQPIEEMASQALAALLDESALSPGAHVHPVSLVVRASSG